MSLRRNSANADGKTPEDIRNDIKLYIRNERDTILKKWMALDEAVHSEDNRREQFLNRMLKQETLSIPLDVRKLIGNLKKAVHKIMIDKGGSPFSILRKMFLYWDSGHLGYLNEVDFKNCIRSLGIQIDDNKLHDIYMYYYNINEANNGGKANSVNKGLKYTDMLTDIQQDEPSIIEYVEGSSQEKHDEEQEMRFKEVNDKFKVMPERVKFYIEALRDFVAVKMRNSGGTPYSHVRKIFMAHDFDYSGKINADVLLYASKKVLKLNLTLKDAQDICDFYDRKSQGVIDYHLIINDVAHGITSVLAYVENTPRTIAESKRRLAINPLYHKPFYPKPNQTLESVKLRTHESLLIKMRDVGGSYKSWIAESIRYWDPRDTGYLNSIDDLKGFFKKLGVTITTDEANNIFHCYDKDNTGKLKHEYLSRDLIGSHTETDVFFNNSKDSDGSRSRTLNETVASAALPSTLLRVTPPKVVKNILDKIKRSLEVTDLKTKGKMNIQLEARDLLHGTFLRFDPNSTGKVDLTTLLRIFKELKINVDQNKAQAFLTWFDNDGSDLLDYNSLVNQLCKGLNYDRSSDVYARDFMNYDVSETRLLPFLETNKLGKTLASNMNSNERLMPYVPSDGNKFKVQQFARTLHLDDPDAVASSKPGSTLPGFTVGANTSASFLQDKERKKIKLIETRAISEIRRKMMQANIEEKKKVVLERLNEVESQRKEILEKFGHKIH